MAFQLPGGPRTSPGLGTGLSEFTRRDAWHAIIAGNSSENCVRKHRRGRIKDLQKEIASGAITWRCWWEQRGKEGPIPQAWNVHRYPTVYVLDHKGVIQLKITGVFGDSNDDRQPPIEKFLDLLLKEGEAAKTP